MVGSYQIEERTAPKNREEEGYYNVVKQHSSYSSYL